MSPAPYSLHNHAPGPPGLTLPPASSIPHSVSSGPVPTHPSSLSLPSGMHPALRASPIPRITISPSPGAGDAGMGIPLVHAGSPMTALEQHQLNALLLQRQSPVSHPLLTPAQHLHMPGARLLLDSHGSPVNMLPAPDPLYVASHLRMLNSQPPRLSPVHSHTHTMTSQDINASAPKLYPHYVNMPESSRVLAVHTQAGRLPSSLVGPRDTGHLEHIKNVQHAERHEPNRVLVTRVSAASHDSIGKALPTYSGKPNSFRQPDHSRQQLHTIVAGVPTTKHRPHPGKPEQARHISAIRRTPPPPPFSAASRLSVSPAKMDTVNTAADGGQVPSRHRPISSSSTDQYSDLALQKMKQPRLNISIPPSINARPDVVQQLANPGQPVVKSHVHPLAHIISSSSPINSSNSQPSYSSPAMVRTHTAVSSGHRSQTHDLTVNTQSVNRAAENATIRTSVSPRDRPVPQSKAHLVISHHQQSAMQLSLADTKAAPTLHSNKAQTRTDIRSEAQIPPHLPNGEASRAETIAASIPTKSQSAANVDNEWQSMVSEKISAPYIL